MRIHPPIALAAALAASALQVAPAEAFTLRWARAVDALTLDPHAEDHGPTHALNHQIYEPLVLRDAAAKLQPALAQQWVQTSDPRVWEFQLRAGVVFHDGAAFTSDDVVFSLERALAPGSGMRELLSGVEGAEKVGDLTVRIRTRTPSPRLPDHLGTLFIMDEGWARANGAERVPQAGGQDAVTARNANGTGPYRLVSREPEGRTVLRRFERYWGEGQFPLAVTEIVHARIPSHATRIAALLSDEVDFVQDVPLPDIERLRSNGGVRVKTGLENRTVFVGLNVGSPDLKSDKIEDKNPLADRRVRRAMALTVNRARLAERTMHGAALPAGSIVSPLVEGWTQDLDRTSKPDIAAAKKLMAEAGYSKGFDIALHCGNDRVANDEATAQALASMLAQINIRADPAPRAPAVHFRGVLRGGTDLYLMDWSTPTYDAQHTLSALAHSRKEGHGLWNATGYDNADLDRRIQALEAEADEEKRSAAMAAIWEALGEAAIYIPLHHRMLAYATRGTLDIPVDPENQPKMKYVAGGP